MVRIITDSASDIDSKAAKELGVICVPLTVSFGDEDFKENEDISRTEFYQRLITDSDFPRTSQVPPYAFEQAFRAAKEAGDDVVAILLSSRLSGTYQSAKIAETNVYGKGSPKEEVRETGTSCYVIDSHTASGGEQLLVEYAAELKKQGNTAKEIVKKVCRIRSNLRLFACVNTLEYLHRGGRISKVAAAIGTLINVKPILFVKENGEPAITARVRGNQKAITYVLEQIKNMPPDERYPIYIMYSYADEGAKRLRKAIQMAGYQVQMKHVIHVGAVIGSHIGPNAYGVTYVCRQEQETEKADEKEPKRS